MLLIRYGLIAMSLGVCVLSKEFVEEKIKGTRCYLIPSVEVM